MKVLFYKFLGKRIIPVEDYRDKIIDRFLSDTRFTDKSGLWEYIKKEYNADQVYSWREQQNYLKFNSEQDYMMFLLKL